MKTLLSRFALAVSFIGSCALVSVTPAKAITWNLSNPSGEQSTSNTLTSTTGGYKLGTAGFTYTGAFASFTAVDTYGKVTSGDATETGLGLGNKGTGALVDPKG